MSELLKEEEVEMEVTDEYGEVIYSGTYEEFLAQNDYDIELEEGDTLYIPAENKVINVVGAVMSNGSFIYNEKWGYEDYVQMAGGYSRHADEDNVFVMKVDGSARKLSRGFMNWSPLKKRWEIAGFNESRGFWKIIPISLPLIFSSSFSDA